jgi:hypothetical protein
LAYEGRDDRAPDGPVVSAADERGGLEEALRVQRSEEELRVREREAGQVNGSWAAPWVVPGEPGPAAVDRSKNETKLKTTQSLSDGLGAESAEGNGEKPGARRLRR